MGTGRVGDKQSLIRPLSIEVKVECERGDKEAEQSMRASWKPGDLAACLRARESRNHRGSNCAREEAYWVRVRVYAR